MSLEAWITISDEKGRVESHKKANSLVLNFIDWMACVAGEVTTSMTDMGGTSRSQSFSAAPYRFGAAVSTSTYGIRVGTGSTAVALTDTALVTPIVHGTGAGQLSHGAHSVSGAVTSGTSRQFTVSRTFTNNTANPITVNEIGLAGLGSTSTYYFLVDRTLSTFTINAGASKTVTYTIMVTV